MFDKHDFVGVIQRFGNIHSQEGKNSYYSALYWGSFFSLNVWAECFGPLPGEYSLDAMLIAAPNVALHIMPLPIVSHQRNRYTVFIKRGIKHLKQSRVYFQCTPSC